MNKTKKHPAQQIAEETGLPIGAARRLWRKRLDKKPQRTKAGGRK